MKRAVAGDADHAAVGPRQLRADRRRQAEAHRARAAARQVMLGPAEAAVLRHPHLVLAHVAGDDRLSSAPLGQPSSIAGT